MRTRRRQGSAMLGPGAGRLSPRTGGLERPRCPAAFPGSRARDPADGLRYAACHRRLLPANREPGPDFPGERALGGMSLEDRVDRGTAAAGDGFRVFVPV